MPFVDDEVVTAVKLNEATFQSWETWTPTLTNLTLGSGTVVARWTPGSASGAGKLIVCYFSFTLGAGSAVGTNPTVSMPVTASSSYLAGISVVGQAQLTDTGTAAYGGFVRVETSTTFRVLTLGSAGAVVLNTAVSSTVPFTWVSTDVLSFQAVYEAA